MNRWVLVVCVGWMGLPEAWAEGEPVGNVSVTSTAEPTPGASVQVERLALGTAVENRDIVGEAASFDAAVERVYAWTLVSAPSVPATIRHVWYEGDIQRADVPLMINYPRTRTWSYKTVTPGRWRLDVVGKDGVVVTSASFTVGQEVPAPAQAQ